ncbi:MAG TPA: pantoate--beta-alanine ligase [Candidatus Krumholzibacteria bacterium]|nr:pantoate--beta-alanine ligase [Candidatus Krumholzibacteria bacterium]
MHVFTEIAPLRRHLAAARAGRRLAFVPTMGALHAGHGACIAAARAVPGSLTVCSIFVNPTQFGAGEDLDAYPRLLDADLARLEAWQCDAVFTPAPAVMYPEPQTVWVDPGPLAGPLCGPFRPGHFRGVATVVGKLFAIVQPDVAVFGQKDAQQALIVRAMTRQFNLPVDIAAVPTVREPDGLAMSSRNAYLSPPERARAAGVFVALSAARERLEAGERAARTVEAAARATLEARGIRSVEYAELRRADDLSALEHAEGRVILAIAARVGATRLIDNMVFDVAARPVRSDVPLF